MKKTNIILMFFLGLIWQTNAQFTEDFESGTFPPTDWAKEVADTSNDITQSDEQNHTTGGTYSARFSSWNTSSDYNQYLFTKAITVQAGVNNRISFWHKKDNTSNETLEWGISTAGQASTDVTTWTAVSLDRFWQQETIDLSAYDGQTIYFSWHYYGNYLYYVYIDDVVNDAIPSCPTPVGLSASNLTDSQAELFWTAGGSESTWNIEWGPAGFTQGNGTIINGITNNPYTLTGLSADTTYDYYVQADCGGGDISTWTEPYTFTTSCGIISNFPFNYGFEDVTSNYGGDWDSSCWFADPQNTGASPYSPPYRWTVINGNTPSSGDSGPIGANSGTQYAYTEASGSNAGDEAKLVSPIFDMSSLTSPQVSFYYHMYGFSMGSLSLDTYDGTTWTNDVWTISGQQQTSDTDPWIMTIVDIPQNTTQIRFRAIRGSDNRSDMAIDDISIKETPSCSPPTSLSVSNITTNQVDLSWTAGGSETAWNIEWGPAGFTQGSGTIVNGITNNPYTLTGLSADTSYDFYVQADCGGGDTSIWSNVYSFYTGYCISNPSSNDGNGITQVELGTTTLAIPDVTYQDETGTVVDIQQGINNNLQITFETGYTYDTNVWIDLNDNFQFETSELVYQGTSASDNPTTLDASFNLSATANLGNHRMRIGAADAGQNPPNPCYNGILGVTIDITVNVIPAASCPPVTNLSASNITGDQAELSWTTGGNETTWNIEYGATGFTQGSGTVINGVTNNPYTLTGLSTQTSYDYYVQADCGGGDTSIWIGPYTFTTVGTCGIFTVSLIDSWGDGWNGSSLYVYLNGTLFNTYTLLDGAGPEDYTIPVNIGDILSFDFTAGPYPSENEYIVLDENGNEVAHEGANGTRPGDIGDHFVPSGLTACLTCPAPTDLSVVRITDDEADLSWTENGSATVWNIEYGAAGFTQGNGTTITATSNPYTLTGLTAQTSYDFYVQADCGGGDTSTWIGPYTFTLITLPGCGDTFYDDGGPNGNYSANLNLIYTIYPENAGDAVTLTFNLFDMEGAFDGVMIYDGTDNTAPIFDSGSTFNNSTCPNGSWTGGPGDTFTADGQSFTATNAAGALTLVFMSDSSYQDEGWEAEITCAPNALATQQIEGIKFYPNPVNNILNISAQENIQSIAVYNISGQEVLSLQPNNTQQEIDMSHLLNGMYFVKIQVNNKLSAFKIIKE